MDQRARGYENDVFPLQSNSQRLETHFPSDYPPTAPLLYQGQNPCQPPTAPQETLSLWSEPSASRYVAKAPPRECAAPDENYRTGPMGPLHTEGQVNRGPKKKALLIGCNYPESSQLSLKSCVNDATALYFTLMEDFGYEEENMKILVDHAALQTQWPVPSRQNIIKGMRWLVADAKSGDKLFFHFSGHGTSSINYSKEESDGKNQCLMPTDYMDSGVLVDHDVNQFLIRPLPEGCILHALVDCCHSGTIMDLQFIANGDKWDNLGVSRNYKGTSGGLVFQFAACRDEQESFEGEDGDVSCGAATAAFIEALLDPTIDTYEKVLQFMTEDVKKTTGGKITASNSLKRLQRHLKHPVMSVQGRLYQRPQLSCNTDTIGLDHIMSI